MDDVGFRDDEEDMSVAREALELEEVVEDRLLVAMGSDRGGVYVQTGSATKTGNEKVQGRGEVMKSRVKARTVCPREDAMQRHWPFHTTYEK